MRHLLNIISIDLRGIAALRILTAILVIIDLLSRVGDLKAFYSDDGLIPRTFLLKHSQNPEYIYSLNLCSGRVEIQAVLLIIAISAACAMMLGYKSKLNTFLTYLLYTSFKLRNMYVLDSGHDMLNMLLFWQLFLPVGRTLSLDSLASPKKNSSNSYISVASLAFIVQLCIVYYSQSFNKTDPAWTDDFTALYYALHLDPFCTPLGKWLLNYPNVTQVLTALTIYLQSYGFYLLAIPFLFPFFRILTVLLFIGFHIGTSLFLGLGLLPYVFIVAWIPLLPPFVWNKMEKTFVLNKVLRPFYRLEPFVHHQKPVSKLSQLTTQILAGVFMIFITFCTFKTNESHQLSASNTSDTIKNDWFPQLRRALGIKTKWTMFSPKPPEQNAWYILAATKENGDVIDLMKNGSPISFKKPERSYHLDYNTRWNNFIFSLQSPPKTALYGAFGTYMHNRYKETTPTTNKIKQIKLIMISQKTRGFNDLKNRKARIKERTLWTRTIK